jgi:hypothetical protein
LNKLPFPSAEVGPLVCTRENSTRGHGEFASGMNAVSIFVAPFANIYGGEATHYLPPSMTTKTFVDVVKFNHPPRQKTELFYDLFYFYLQQHVCHI